jgi:hypothetical protein
VPAVKVSILLCVYNAARTLQEAVDSILVQSFRDFELIIVDDGSTDDSAQLLAAYGTVDARVKIIPQGNSGLVGALNRGLIECSGAFVARMDADDRAWPDRLNRQVAYLDANPAFVAVGGQIRIIDSAGSTRRLGQYPVGLSAVSDLLRTSSPFAHPAVTIRRQSLLSVGGYRSAFEYAEDYDLWLRLSEIGQLDNLPEIVLDYRWHGANVSALKAEAQAFATAAAMTASRVRKTEGRDPFGELGRTVNMADLAPYLRTAMERARFDALVTNALTNNGGILAPGGVARTLRAIRSSAARDAADLAARAAYQFFAARRHQDAAHVLAVAASRTPIEVARALVARVTIRRRETRRLAVDLARDDLFKPAPSQLSPPA